MIISLDELKQLSKAWAGKKVGIVTGCFDILHRGHVEILEFAKSKVDILLCGIDSDTTVKASKGTKRPIFDEDNRATVIDSIRFADYTFIFSYSVSRKDPEILSFFVNLYEDLAVTHIITNSHADDSYKNKRECANRLGIELVLQDTDKFSSSS